MEIIKLDEKHLESVSELFTRNYMKVREKQKILPEKYANKETIFELLHDLSAKSAGFVAVDNNDVIGYLIGIPIPDFKGTQRGIYCPEWAHAVISRNKAEVYQKLYDNASKIWVDNGYLNHAISILGYDDEHLVLEWIWITCGRCCS